MQEEEVDIVLLQDVDERAWHPNQGVEIAHLTGYAMVFVPTQRYFPWPSVGTGIAILSRFPITNPMATEIISPGGIFASGESERRVLQRVEISLDGMSVVVFNTHFPMVAEERTTAAYRLWTQVLQEEAVLVVVGGNFNAQPLEKSMAFLQGKETIEGLRGELTDSWLQAGIGPAETFPSEQPEQRIDYIFYQAEPSVIVQEAHVIGRGADIMADHAAVVTTFATSPARDQETPFVEEPVGSLEPTGGGGNGFFDRY
jgi:endonuclease/exonuclease/phosphatase family metal-dependent hydrolase